MSSEINKMNIEKLQKIFSEFVINDFHNSRLTQNAYADKLGITRQTIAKILRGEIPSLNMINQISPIINFVFDIDEKATSNDKFTIDEKILKYIPDFPLFVEAINQSLALETPESVAVLFKKVADKITENSK